MAICVSGYFDSRTNKLLASKMPQREGTVKVAPLGVTRGVSTATGSGADPASLDCGVGKAGAEPAVCADALNAKAIRATRNMDMEFPHFAKRRKVEKQRYTHHNLVVKLRHKKWPFSRAACKAPG